MKNIHLLRTNLSRLYYSISMSGYNLKLSAIPYHQSSEIRPQHLYITSDEEIKPNTYCLINGVLCKTEIREGKIVSRQLTGGATMDICKSEYLEIILTTDNRLIADGVQAIDDDFLEWFVKNPSCEEVKVRKNPKVSFIVKGKGVQSFNQGYRIIIPKEEPKDVILGYKTSLDAQMLDKVEPKQETLEDIKLEVVLESSHCQFSVVENKLATIYRNQEKILTAIKLLNNEQRNT